MTVWLLATGLAWGADAANGKRLYESNCLACHGAALDGDGPAAKAMRPPPTDFTQKAYWVGKTDAQIRGVIVNGISGSVMMPFNKLKPAQVDDLIAYLKTVQPK